ncbi:hypothetical protein D3C86_1338500 [compost metagenome]
MHERSGTVIMQAAIGKLQFAGTLGLTEVIQCNQSFRSKVVIELALVDIQQRNSRGNCNTVLYSFNILKNTISKGWGCKVHAACVFQGEPFPATRCGCNIRPSCGVIGPEHNLLLRRSYGRYGAIYI